MRVTDPVDRMIACITLRKTKIQFRFIEGGEFTELDRARKLIQLLNKLEGMRKCVLHDDLMRKMKK
jgi:hypothetical protein